MLIQDGSVREYEKPKKLKIFHADILDNRYEGLPEGESNITIESLEAETEKMVSEMMQLLGKTSLNLSTNIMDSMSVYDTFFNQLDDIHFLVDSKTDIDEKFDTLNNHMGMCTNLYKIMYYFMENLNNSDYILNTNFYIRTNIHDGKANIKNDRLKIFSNQFKDFYTSLRKSIAPIRILNKNVKNTLLHKNSYFKTLDIENTSNSDSLSIIFGYDIKKGLSVNKIKQNVELFMNNSKENIVEQIDNGIKSNQRYLDGLTGLVNRNYLKSVENFYKNIPFTFVLLDLDKFKDVNDDDGHPFGDTVLKVLVNILLRHGLKYDDVTIARAGGEEFIMLLPFIDDDKIIDLLNNITLDFKNKKISNENGSYYHMTGSIGAYKHTGKNDNTFNEIFNGTDKLSYEAKEGCEKYTGRDTIVLGGDEYVGAIKIETKSVSTKVDHLVTLENKDGYHDGILEKVNYLSYLLKEFRNINICYKGKDIEVYKYLNMEKYGTIDRNELLEILDIAHNKKGLFNVLRRGKYDSQALLEMLNANIITEVEYDSIFLKYDYLSKISEFYPNSILKIKEKLK